MKKQKLHLSLSMLLMMSSVVLLSIFLGLWLRQAYQQAYTNLQKEVSFLFLNSVQTTQTDLFTEVFPLSFQKKDTSNQVGEWKINIKIDDTTDLNIDKEINQKKVLSKSMTIVYKDSLAKKNSTYISAIKMDTDSIKSTKHIILAGDDHKLDQDIQSSIAFLARLKKEGQIPNLEMKYPQDSSTFQLIQQHFDSTVATKNLPIQVQLTQLKQDSLEQKQLLSEVYQDKWTNEQFAAEVLFYKPYLFKKILPQILFSILLLVCILAAFFSIYYNMRQQQRLIAIKNDFISNVTHELKTPITTVGVAIEALSNFDALQNPERTQEYLDISKMELQRLSILVDKVLKMSLFEKKEPELKLELLDLQILIQSILNSFKLQFEKLAAEVDFQTTGANFVVQGDKTHLTSVIYNLLDNALKYSPEQPQIEVSLDGSADQIKVRVQDAGMGIEKVYLDKIFDKFFRVPTGNAHNVKGHGLGLNYVASVIQKHQGEIQVESQVGKGSSFTVLFPRHLR